MRRGVCVLAAAVGLTLTAGASAIESTIYPGVGIGKVRLGMTRAQVERLLGRDAIVNGRATIAATEYVELAWNFATWTVAFAQTRSGLRVVQVGTTAHGQRTPTRIGIGTLWRPLVRAYPHGLCAFGNSLGLPKPTPDRFRMGVYLEYLVPHAGGTQTIYVLQDVFSEKLQQVNGYRVLEVHVRSAFVPLEEFKPDSRSRCRTGWEDTDVPH
jgi:hypothetical protein